MYTTFVGVDCGVSGGVGVISTGWMVNGDSTFVKVFPMPETEKDIWGLFAGEILFASPMIAVVEKLHARPTDADLKRIHALARMMHHYGGVRMALIGNDITFVEETPQKWQKAVGVPSDGTKGHAHKVRLKARAQQLYPEVKGITLKTCDALLIAHYCWERYSRAD